MKKEEKNPVGRPKLADKKLIKESIFVCIFVFVITLFIAYNGYQIITIDNKFNYSASVYNDHINTCKISNNIIDCGPNVTYMKYSYDNINYKEIYKEDKSIKVKYNNKNIKVCYKLKNNDELKCLK